MWQYNTLEPTVPAVWVLRKQREALSWRPQYRDNLEKFLVIASWDTVINYVNTSSYSRAMLNSLMDIMVV